MLKSQKQEIGNYDVTNTPFLHFFAGNIPWITQSLHFCPLSRIDDGMNDIVYCTQPEAGRISLARTLIAGDNGDYFGENGDNLPELRQNYVKCN